MEVLMPRMNLLTKGRTKVWPQNIFFEQYWHQVKFNCSLWHTSFHRNYLRLTTVIFLLSPKYIWSDMFCPSQTVDYVNSMVDWEQLKSDAADHFLPCSGPWLTVWSKTWLLNQRRFAQPFETSKSSSRPHLKHRVFLGHSSWQFHRWVSSKVPSEQQEVKAMLCPAT